MENKGIQGHVRVMRVRWTALERFGVMKGMVVEMCAETSEEVCRY